LMRVQAKEAPKARSSWHCTKVLPETVVEQAALASDGEFPKHNRARIASTIHDHDPRVSAMVLQPLSLPYLSHKASGLLHRNNLNIQATTQLLAAHSNFSLLPSATTKTWTPLQSSQLVQDQEVLSPTHPNLIFSRHRPQMRRDLQWVTSRKTTQIGTRGI
jgi:hypothetical protein